MSGKWHIICCTFLKLLIKKEAKTSQNESGCPK
jgi:hypothetical protein